MKQAEHAQNALTPGEVAAKFNVDPKTVSRWARDGKLPYFRTPGGHRRYYAADVDELLASTHKPKYVPPPAVPSMTEINRILADHLAAEAAAGAA